MADDSSTENGTKPETSLKPRRSWFDRCQPLVGIISPLIAVLSFFSGTIFSAYQVRKSSRSAEDNEWRESLQKATFAESDMIPSAFLLESFYKSPVYEYRAQARELQFVMLDRTTTPEVFDLIFQNMLRDAASSEVSYAATVQDAVHDILSVGATLDEHVRTVYEAAVPEANRAQTPLAIFLADPQPFYTSSDSDKQKLKQLLSYMWELDTFSDGMSCVWTTHRSDCPHLKNNIEGTADVFLVNHSVPSPNASGPKFTSYSTCSVHHAPDSTFYCDPLHQPQ